MQVAARAAWFTGASLLRPGRLEPVDCAGTTLAKTAPGWQPRYDAASALAELVDGPGHQSQS